MFDKNNYCDDLKKEFELLIQHLKVKPDILCKAGNFSKLIGKNLDIKIIGDKIKLIGTGPFKGKSFNTDLNASDFFGGY